jgi:hypothetical protein
MDWKEALRTGRAEKHRGKSVMTGGIMAEMRNRDLQSTGKE